MSATEVPLAGAALPAPPAIAEPASRGLLRRVVAYALSRGATEGLLAVRGILLAALLGPAAFGSWALLRLWMRFASLGGLGINRGLEFELLEPGGTRAGTCRSPAGVALGFLLLVGCGLAAAALVASFVAPSADIRLLLRGFAAASVSEAVYGYALVCLRVRGSLRRYAALEAGTAALHLVGALALARIWGLGGACAGLALGNLAGLAAAARWVDLRPRWHPETLGRLLRLGVPLALASLVGTLLLTADRWVIAGWGGATMLGYYAFAGSVATASTALALVIRTVVFTDVYGDAQSTGSAAAVRGHLDRAVLPFARLLPPVLGACSLVVGPVVAIGMPGYAPAIPSARLFFLGGAAMGIVNLASVGAVAAGLQRRLPLYAGLALALTIALSMSALGAGLGLEGVAAASFAGHLLLAAAILLLTVREGGLDRARRRVAMALLPLVWCAGVVVLAGRLFPDYDPGSAALALAVYAALLLPIAPAWRAELQRVRR
ncbi:MAG: hypothetical protein H0T86_07660 [Gemmatimonadales bacterium]|nr:hypothetical protein [Gemmatimonadales bacterium]